MRKLNVITDTSVCTSSRRRGADKWKEQIKAITTLPSSVVLFYHTAQIKQAFEFTCLLTERLRVELWPRVEFAADWAGRVVVSGREGNGIGVGGAVPRVSELY